MFRKPVIVAISFAAAALAATALPARAFPTFPPDSLFVTAYYSDASKTQLVGQKWSGCGQPSGSWGITSPYRDLFFPAC